MAYLATASEDSGRAGTAAIVVIPGIVKVEAAARPGADMVAVEIAGAAAIPVAEDCITLRISSNPFQICA